VVEEEVVGGGGVVGGAKFVENGGRKAEKGGVGETSWPNFGGPALKPIPFK